MNDTGLTEAERVGSSPEEQAAINAQIPTEGGDPNAGARMISQRECCAQHELRHEAMRYALSAFASAEIRKFDANEIVKQAKIFEAFLKGD